METTQALAIFFSILLIGLAGFYLGMLVTSLLTNKTVSALSLFKDFKQKMWMTAGLGILFFGLYFLVVYTTSLFINSENRLNIFLLIYKNPIPFIYLGLVIFVCISSSIYLVRMIIKHLYNTRKRD